MYAAPRRQQCNRHPMFYLGLTIALFLLRFALAGQRAFRKQVYFIVLVGAVLVLRISLPSRM